MGVHYWAKTAVANSTSVRAWRIAILSSYTAPEPETVSRTLGVSSGFPAWPRGCDTYPSTATRAFDALALGPPVGADDPASSLMSTSSRCCAGPAA